MNNIDTSEYKQFFNEVSQIISKSKLEAYSALNKCHIQQYFDIGKSIVDKQAQYGWGKSVVEMLANDLKASFNGIEGYSPQNLWYMRQFYFEYNQEPVLFELSKNVPWGQNLLLLSNVKTQEAREYYLKATIANGWSRSVLLNQIKAGAFENYKLNPKQHNFELALPEYLHEQATESLKSVYNLDFLGISKPIHERQLENLMVENIKRVILELGYGFCFIGNQYRISLDEKEYFIDLLFFHRKLKCLVAIELKTTEFIPEYAGKMNFYLALLDDFVRQPDENPSIGIILCASKKSMEVEYALRVSSKPIGVAEYQLTQKLPNALSGQLPSAEEIIEKTKLYLK